MLDRRTLMEEPIDPASLPPLPETSGPFSDRLYFFSTGVRTGELCTIRSESGETLLTYRSFANVVGIVAALVAAIVGVAGLAGTALLLAERAPFRAAAALGLTLMFALLIALLVPKASVALQAGADPALTIVQVASIPRARYAVSTPDGTTIAEMRRGVTARFGRDRWSFFLEGVLVGKAFEPSLGAALLRKLAGKFSRGLETDLVVEHGGMETARIHRRRDSDGRADYLEITSDLGDRRLAVALATILFGSEP